MFDIINRVDLQDGEKPEMPFRDDGVSCVWLFLASVLVQLGKIVSMLRPTGPDTTSALH